MCARTLVDMRLCLQRTRTFCRRPRGRRRPPRWRRRSPPTINSVRWKSVNGGARSSRIRSSKPAKTRRLMMNGPPLRRRRLRHTLWQPPPHCWRRRRRPGRSVPICPTRRRARRGSPDAGRRCASVACPSTCRAWTSRTGPTRSWTSTNWSTPSDRFAVLCYLLCDIYTRSF